MATETFPTNKAPVILRQRDDTMSLEILQWGFKKWDGKGVVINARVETLQTKSMFAKLLAARRCVVPASEYYEWKNPQKLKYHIKDKDDNLLFMAGLYQDGDKGREFVIITKDATEEVARVHNRMPVLLRADHIEQWLSGKLSPDDIAKTEFDMEVEACENEQLSLFHPTAQSLSKSNL